MANNKNLQLTSDNIFEWLCSTGYLLPSNEVELSRFERLGQELDFQVNENAIDPFAIINGTRQRKKLSISNTTVAFPNQEELRMAARKHKGLPSNILDQIKKNQQKKKDGDKQ